MKKSLYTAKVYVSQGDRLINGKLLDLAYEASDMAEAIQYLFQLIKDRNYYTKDVDEIKIQKLINGKE